MYFGGPIQNHLFELLALGLLRLMHGREVLDGLHEGVVQLQGVPVRTGRRRGCRW